MNTAGPPLLVCVTPYVPYPGIDHAGGEFLRRYLDVAVARGWSVRLIAPRTPENERALLLDRDFEVVLVPETRGLPARLRRLVVTGVPASTGRVWLDRLPEPARRWLAEADVVDLQWSDSIWNAPAIRRLVPGVVLVAVAHDIRVESLSRALRHGGFRPRLGALVALPSAAVREARCLSVCDHVSVFKEADRRRLVAAGVKAEVGLVPPPDATDLPAPSPRSPRLLFVGSFRRSENVEAASWLVRVVLPLVLASRPEVVLRLAGSSPPPTVQRLGSPRVEVTGYLPSIRAAYDDVCCVVVPLRRGAGVKFKTVHAVEAGFPVVSTSVGAEGVAEVTGIRPRFVSDEAQDFADNVLAVLADPEAAIEAAAVSVAAASGRPTFEAEVTRLLDRFLELGPAS